MAHPFEITNEFEVDATPEEVWQAIATGSGMDAWFMGRNEIEPGEGGVVRTALPGFTMEGTITTWEPPNRFAERSPEGEDGSLHVFEYLVEGRDRGSTVVRWVHSGFLGDDWEAEYEGLREGDPMYFHKLAQYLTHFRGRRATPVHVFGVPVPEAERAWDVFRGGLGLGGEVAVDDRVRLTPGGFDPIDGLVDYRTPSFLGVRSDDALYRFMITFDGSAGLGHHLFTEGLDQAETERAWADWLRGLFS